jgi:hypothetical protein
MKTAQFHAFVKLGCFRCSVPNQEKCVLTFFNAEPITWCIS